MTELEHLAGICKALGLIPTPPKGQKGKRKGQKTEGNLVWVG